MRLYAHCGPGDGAGPWRWTQNSMGLRHQLSASALIRTVLLAVVAAICMDDSATANPLIHMRSAVLDSVAPKDPIVRQGRSSRYEAPA
jgi:hypothetical protein